MENNKRTPEEIANDIKEKFEEMKPLLKEAIDSGIDFTITSRIEGPRLSMTKNLVH